VNQNSELKISGYTDVSGNYIFDAINIQEGVPVNAVVTGKNLAPYGRKYVFNFGTPDFRISLKLFDVTELSKSF